MNHGKTRQINFYNIDQKFYFVDLPGYGYSKMSKTEQDKVGKFIEEYLFSRKNIATILLLVDIRHNPGENDKLMYDYIVHTGLPFLIIATKADKIAITKVDDYLTNLRQCLNVPENILILPSSSERKIYKDNIWTQIEQVL